MKNLNTKYIVLISMGIAALVFAGALLMSKNKSSNALTEKNPAQQTPITSTDDNLEDDIKIQNGIYENHIGGFKFRYNDSVLNKVAFIGKDRTEILTEESDYLPMLYVDLPTEENQFEEIFMNEFKRCMDDKSDSVNFIKLYSNNNGCAVSFNPKGLTDIEPTWGYAGFFNTDIGIVRITLTLSNESEQKEFYDDFQTIFSTFSLTK